MDLWITIKVAVRALIRNKVRTILTMLGIIIGVGAVITMMAITKGANKSIMNSIQSMGNNILYVFASSQTRGGVRGGWGSITTLKPSDADAIQKNCPHIEYASPAINMMQRAIYKNRNWNTNVLGGNEHIKYIQAYQVDRGSFFTSQDVTSSAKVCVIGRQVEENLFNIGEDPIGKFIRIDRVPFRVVGVLESKGTSNGSQDQDDLIIIPYSTMMQRTYKQDYIRMLLASATSQEDSEKARDEISRVLRQRHRLTDMEDDDFVIHTQEETMKMVSSLTQTLTILLSSVALVSLLVGGIGIMNIMLVSVTERIREIGIRMAIGGRGSDILRQFLIESITLSLAGGIIGVGFGYLASFIVKSSTGWNVYITFSSILLSIAFSSIVGVFFGFFPAWKASKLDIIEALRHE